MTSIKNISATMRERKHLPCFLEIKSMDEEGHFAGYASVFDVVDNQRDIMLPGAFTASLKYGIENVKMLWQHQTNEPIGIFTRIFEDEVGLYVEGRLLMGVQKAREAHLLLQSGAVKGLSIGYSPKRYRMDADTGVRLLIEVDLFEVSLVTFPANEKSQVTVVKSMPIHMEEKSHPEDLIALSDALDRAIHNLQH